MAPADGGTDAELTRVVEKRTVDDPVFCDAKAEAEDVIAGIDEEPSNVDDVLAVPETEEENDGKARYPATKLTPAGLKVPMPVLSQHVPEPLP